MYTRLRGELRRLKHRESKLSTRDSKKTAQAQVYKQLPRWTKDVDLFKKDFVFVPINESLHWTLVLIYKPGLWIEQQRAASVFPEPVCVDGASLDKAASAQSSDKAASAQSNGQQPRIFYLDSLGGSKDEAFEILKTYLGLEYEHKHKTIEAPAEQHSVHGEPQLQSAATERFDQLKAAEVEVPHQNNGYDCGLYMLKFIHLIAEHQPDFSDEETPRWASHPEIGFRRGEITELRRRMAKDIREMARLRVP